MGVENVSVQHNTTQSDLQNAAIRQVFDELDTTKDGRIDVAELQRGLKRLQLPATKQVVDEIMRLCDAKQRGYFYYQDFEQFVQSREAELRHTFDLVDVNRDGKIDAAEIKAGISKLKMHVTSDEINEMMKLVDSDGDGYITFAEWHSFLMLLPSQTKGADYLRFAFDHWRHATSQLDYGDDHTSHVSLADESVTKELAPWKFLVSGGVAGAVSRTVTAPLDRLKVLLQLQLNAKGSSAQYTGVIQGLAKIYREGGGFHALFRGNGANCIKIVPETAVKFFAYESFKKLLSASIPFFAASEDSAGNQEIALQTRFVAGSLAGVCAQTLIYPLECVKTRLAGSQPGQRLGIIEVLSDIIRTRGVLALYRGILPTLLGIVPYAGIDLAVYETLKEFYTKRVTENNNNNNNNNGDSVNYQQTVVGTTTMLACAATSSTIAQVVAYPLNLVRTRMQAQGMAAVASSSHTQTIAYKGMFDVFRQTYTREGVRGFYRGIFPNMLKVVPAVSISYVVYENMKRVLR